MLQNSPYKVMLSATVGAHDAFDENIGIKLTNSKESEMMRIPSTFDFTKSPIYYLPKYKMSKYYIEQNFQPMQQLIMQIISSAKHNNEKGIIHTGSYKNALRLFQMMPDNIRKRLFIYGSSKEKNTTLYDFETSDNGILVGPTLTEGIDLPDDGCRFIIIMKIPYPNLGDNLVLAKVKIFPRWYNSETSNTVIQAIGRGNRTPTDWCTTYILDGNFGQLYQETITQYPEELQKRMQVVNM
jgi:Rad3-related DNA helicase